MVCRLQADLSLFATPRKLVRHFPIVAPAQTWCDRGMRFPPNLIVLILAIWFVPHGCETLLTSVKADRATGSLHERLEPLLELCRNASRLEVFEGLPHQEREKELMELEKQRDDVMTNHGFRFYAPAVGIRENDARSLHARVCKLSAYYGLIPNSANCPCCIFHPDLLLRFHTEEDAVDVHLCFGCDMANFYKEVTTIRAGMDDSIWNFWEVAQVGLQLKRPEENTRNDPADSTLPEP
jgi:hypothetical protein